ncbi:hypothetical protein MBR06_005502, partial [Klebsiella pneumoniae]|nr:hypothetical protein [Klebsiella pneumoniae]HBY5591218.1 hypothetical protein [Klebsiella pneumoniae]
AIFWSKNMALNPPLGNTSPEVLLDNAKRLDELVNGPAATVPDRADVPLDSWRQIMAMVAAAIIEAQNSITAIGLPFTDEAEVQAAADDGKIPVGAVAWVRSTDGSSLADEYMNVAGTMTATGRKMPSQLSYEAVVQALSVISGMVQGNSLDAFYFFAKNGIIGRLRGDSTLECYAAILSELAISGVSIKSGRYPFSWGAENGFLMTLDDTGKLEGIEADFQELKIAGVDVKTLISQSGGDPSYYPGAPGILSGYSHTACVSQSQGVGVPTNGVIHSAPFDASSLMLNGGLRSYGTDGYDTSVSQGNYYILLKPMYEVTGETFMSGHAVRARAFLNSKYPDLNVKRIYTVSGQGGATVSLLKKGTAAYSRTLTQWVALINLIQSMGEAYRCASLIFSQGGSDDGVATNPDTWEATVRQMRSDFTADIKSQTGLHVDPPYIINQINNYMRYPALNGKPNIGLRQYKMVTEQGNDFYGSCPTYILDFIDVAHWTKESQVKVGAYMEKVERNLLLTGGTWKPVHPIKITTSGRFTTAKFNLPEGGTLQFNTDIVNEVPTSYGFSAEQADGTAIGIDRVRLIANDTVEVRYTSMPLPGAVLMYGQTGQIGDPNASNGSGLGRQNGVRGNLCDNAGDNDKIQINGIDYPLHNWCWMFTENMGVE